MVATRRWVLIQGILGKKYARKKIKQKIEENRIHNSVPHITVKHLSATFLMTNSNTRDIQPIHKLEIDSYSCKPMFYLVQEICYLTQVTLYTAQVLLLNIGSVGRHVDSLLCDVRCIQDDVIEVYLNVKKWIY